MNGGSQIYQMLFQSYFTQFIGALTQQINDILRAVVPWVSLAIAAAVIVGGKQTMFGQLTAGEAATRVGRVIVVSSLMNTTLFSEFVTQLLVQQIPDAITSAVHGNAGLTGARGYDGVDNAIQNLGAQMLTQTVGILWIGYQVAIWMAQFVALLLNGLSFVIWLLAMSTIGLVVAIMPLTLPLWLFDSWRDIGARLLGKLFGLILLLACTQIISNMVVRTTGEFISSPQGRPVAASPAEPEFRMNAGALAYTGGFDAPAGSAANTQANNAAGATVPANATINIQGSLHSLWNIVVAELVGLALLALSAGICMSIAGTGGFSAAPALGFMTMAATRGASMALNAASRARSPVR